MNEKNKSKILVTGAYGLIGTALINALKQLGISTGAIDIRYETGSPYYADICDYDAVKNHMKEVSGVVHLAAVSRVIWGERDPDKCQLVNIKGTENILRAAHQAKHRPWVIYASSREVYGQQEILPVTETAELKPCNVYAHSKVAAEKLVSDYNKLGLVAGILRFSNVYGSTYDHADRVVPAFCRNAVLDRDLIVEGQDNIFDFTHVSDVVRGIILAIDKLENKQYLPTIHFTGGVGTTLRQLASMAIEIADSHSLIKLGQPRNFDVASFIGSPALAKQILGWTPEIALRQGISQLIQAYMALQNSHSNEGELV